MAGQTGRAGIPYPDGQDPHDVPADMGRIAERAAGLVGAPLVTVQERNALENADLYAGRVVYNTTTSTFDVYDGDAWRVQSSHADLGAVAADLAAHEDAGDPHTGSASPSDVSGAVGQHEGRADPHETLIRADGERLPGWVPIHQGDFEFTTVGPVWDIPPGEFTMLRLHAQGTSQANGHLMLRINDSFGGYLYGLTYTAMGTGDHAGSSSGNENSGFPFCIWESDAPNHTTVTLYNTHVNGVVSYSAESLRGYDPPWQAEAVGRTSSNVLVQSVRITQVGVGRPVTQGDFVVEGFRP